MTLGVQEISKDKALAEFAKYTNRILRTYLTKIKQLGYGWLGNKMGYFARGVDCQEKNIMVLVGFLAHRLEDPNSLEITLFPGEKPEYAFVFKEGKKKDIRDETVYGTHINITHIDLPKEQFDIQARCYSMNYDKIPPHLTDVVKNIEMEQTTDLNLKSC